MKSKKYWLAATEVSKGFKSRVRALADAMDISIGALVILALTEFMERAQAAKALQEVEK